MFSPSNFIDPIGATQLDSSLKWIQYTYIIVLALEKHSIAVLHFAICSYFQRQFHLLDVAVRIFLLYVKILESPLTSF